MWYQFSGEVGALLIIRAEQMRVLGEWMLKEFNVRLAVRLRSRLPEECEALEEEELDDLIQHVVRKCQKYGIEKEKDVSILAELAVRFSRDFEHSVEYSWTRALLEKQSDESSGGMAVLYFRMTGQAL